MLTQGIAGPQLIGDGNANQASRLDNQGALIVSELHGRYAEQAKRQNIFSIASQSVATTTVGLATTYTGLCVGNPLGSGVRLSLLKCTVMQSVIQSTQPEAYGIAFGFNAATNLTLTVAVTPQSTAIGSGTTAKAVAATSAGLVTAPLYAAFVQNTSSATVNGPGGVIDFEGAVQLLPGAYAAWVTPGQASVAGLWFSFMWEEVPL